MTTTYMTKRIQKLKAESIKLKAESIKLKVMMMLLMIITGFGKALLLSI